MHIREQTVRAVIALKLAVLGPRTQLPEKSPELSLRLWLMVRVGIVPTMVRANDAGAEAGLLGGIRV